MRLNERFTRPFSCLCGLLHFGAFAIVIMLLMWAHPLIRALHRQLKSRAEPAQATSTNPLE